MANHKKLIRFQIFSALFIILLGIVLHFLFDWSENNCIVAAFSAVNESTWEHLKLIFFPMLITTIIGCFIFKDTFPNFLCSKVLEIIFSMFFIVIFFYTYTGIIGVNYAYLDIGIFLISVILGEFIFYKSISLNNKCNKLIAFIIIILFLLAFITFTYLPPKINLFKDPINNHYGIKKTVIQFIILLHSFSLFIYYI